MTVILVSLFPAQIDKLILRHLISLSFCCSKVIYTWNRIPNLKMWIFYHPSIIGLYTKYLNVEMNKEIIPYSRYDELIALWCKIIMNIVDYANKILLLHMILKWIKYVLSPWFLKCNFGHNEHVQYIILGLCT